MERGKSSLCAVKVLHHRGRKGEKGGNSRIISSRSLLLAKEATEGVSSLALPDQGEKEGGGQASSREKRAFAPSSKGGRKEREKGLTLACPLDNERKEEVTRVNEKGGKAGERRGDALVAPEERKKEWERGSP